MNFRSRSNTRGLKKSGKNRFYDRDSRMEFVKKNNRLEMVISDFDKKAHNAYLSKLRYYEKKYNISLLTARRTEQKRWKDFKNQVNDWNTGKISSADTVGKRYVMLENSRKTTNRIYSRENQNLKPYLQEKRKVMYMRMKGVHDVYSGGAYEEFLENVAKKLTSTKDDVERLLFPKAIEEKSKYVDIKPILNKQITSIEDLIEKRIKEGKLNKLEEAEVRDLIKTGLENVND